MDYQEIVNVALQYSDRAQDVEVVNNMDNFLRIVESRINTKLKVQEMAARATLPTVAGQDYYGLPPGFNGLRDIQYSSANVSGLVTLEYVNPKQANDIQNLNGVSPCYYTIIANQIQIIPAPDLGTLEVVYIRNVTALLPSGTANENWVSTDYPDIYIFGLCAEISAFAKDATAFAIWDARFNTGLEELRDDDSVSRWSGTPLKVRLG